MQGLIVFTSSHNYGTTMTLIKSLIISVLLIITTGCATNSAKVNFDRNTDIDTANYKTFAWLTSAKIMAPAVDINPVMKQRVDSSIEPVSYTHLTLPTTPYV